MHGMIILLTRKRKKNSNSFITGTKEKNKQVLSIYFKSSYIFRTLLFEQTDCFHVSNKDL